jgi:hypothetical protein
MIALDPACHKARQLVPLLDDGAAPAPRPLVRLVRRAGAPDSLDRYDGRP